MIAIRYQPRTCARCGREYVPTGTTQRYCSRGCYKAATRSDESVLWHATVAVLALNEEDRTQLKVLCANRSEWKSMMGEGTA